MNNTSFSLPITIHPYPEFFGAVLQHIAPTSFVLGCWEQHRAQELCLYATLRKSIKLHTQLGKCLVTLSCKPEKGSCALNIAEILQKSTFFTCPSPQAAFEAKAHDSSNGADIRALAKILTQHSLMLRLVPPRCLSSPNTPLCTQTSARTSAITLCSFSALCEVPAGTCSPGCHKALCLPHMSQQAATGKPFFVLGKELSDFEAVECFGLVS